MYSINGKFLTRAMNGQIRVATEIIKELDKIVEPGMVEIVAPESDYDLPGLSNITIKRIGSGNPHFWEQVTYPMYLVRNKKVGINFLNSHPFFRADIAYIHDVLFKAYPTFHNNIYGFLQKQYTLAMALSAVKFSKKIITVSEFSKNEIVKYYHVDPSKVKVIYNAWQHFDAIESDENVFDAKNIEKNNYYLAASAQTPQKNFQWIVENAKYNRADNYVIVGGKEGTTADIGQYSENVRFIGRVSDGELKALMKYAKAFIHPAYYEGFGLTPMEAMAAGCSNIVVANTSCLPEIYGDSAFYIDPDNPNVKIADIISEKLDHGTVLDKFSWAESAKELKNILVSFR